MFLNFVNIFKYVLNMIFICSVLFLIMLYVCILFLKIVIRKISEKNNQKMFYENTLFFFKIKKQKIVFKCQTYFLNFYFKE